MDVMKKLTGEQHPQGLAAEISFSIASETDTLNSSSISRILVLDRLQDPGNVGTLYRTAAALGWQAVCITPGTCDPLSFKAIKASAGASLQLPSFSVTLQEVENLVAASVSTGKSSHLLLASARSEEESGSFTEIVDSIEPMDKVVLVLSSEGQGEGEEPRGAARFLKIPIFNQDEGGVESLNVAAAGAILLHSLRPPAPEVSTSLH